MLTLKSCPRCHGDMQEEPDLHGRYRACVQCGYHRDIETFAVGNYERLQRLGPKPYSTQARVARGQLSPFRKAIVTDAATAMSAMMPTTIALTVPQALSSREIR